MEVGVRQECLEAIGFIISTPLINLKIKWKVLGKECQ